jgi:hypothetical protein
MKKLLIKQKYKMKIKKSKFKKLKEKIKVENWKIQSNKFIQMIKNYQKNEINFFF